MRKFLLLVCLCAFSLPASIGCIDEPKIVTPAPGTKPKLSPGTPGEDSGINKVILLD